MPLAGGYVEIFASVNGDLRPQDVNSVTSLRMKFFFTLGYTAYKLFELLNFYYFLFFILYGLGPDILRGGRLLLQSRQ